LLADPVSGDDGRTWCPEPTTLPVEGMRGRVREPRSTRPGDPMIGGAYPALLLVYAPAGYSLLLRSYGESTYRMEEGNGDSSPIKLEKGE
jgi:hypothetical protein